MKLSDDHHDIHPESAQAPFTLKLAYHPPNTWFKIIQQSLVIANLPAPLHYYNFKAQIGQPNIPIFKSNEHCTDALDTVTLINSVSPHMTGQFERYSKSQECILHKENYQFGLHQQLKGRFPSFRLHRNNPELSVELRIQTQPTISHFAKLKFGLGLYQHWSLLCRCQGYLDYKGQVIPIDHIGSFEYARAFNVPFLALYFYTYQIIQLQDHRQLILLHIRNHYNQVLQSKIYLRSKDREHSICFDQNVVFNIIRFYPRVQTPHFHYMYLAREFSWIVQHGQRRIEIYAQSRGDYKSGLGEGYVGSFQYQIKIDDYYEEGNAGYCEFIDLRPLNWQEMDQTERALIPEITRSAIILNKK